jgi:hypothetical protein
VPGTGIIPFAGIDIVVGRKGGVAVQAQEKHKQELRKNSGLHRDLLPTGYDGGCRKLKT